MAAARVLLASSVSVHLKVALSTKQVQGDDTLTLFHILTLQAMAVSRASSRVGTVAAATAAVRVATSRVATVAVNTKG